ncbi:MAG: GWxTD domain-containing protein [Bacteroidetes bacterium]|nr:GWxTD domain-containing protein [Bacteroidota bacterium]
MRVRELQSALCVLTILSGAATAQILEPPRPVEPQTFVSLTAVSAPGADSLTSRVYVIYRIERDFFVSVRATDSTLNAPYVRKGEILVELFDSTDISAAREISHVVIPDVRSEPVPGERFWHEGITSFVVPAGPYRVFFEATDKESQRRFVHPPTRIRALSGGRHPFALHGLAFVGPRTDDRIPVDCYGNDMLFSAPRELLVACVPPHDTTSVVRIEYAIARVEPEEKSGTTVAADTLERVSLIRGKDLVIAGSSSPPAFAFNDASASRVAYFFVPLRTVNLPLRNYTLTVRVRSGSETATLVRPFRNIWPTMPASLKVPELALNALRFITTEDQLDSLKSGGFERQRENLERFWAPKDATPGTALNEVMAEYYRRVDAAMREFGTLKEPDGTMSDRGRIYILYGPPTRTERSLQPSGGHTETWIYERLNRRFTFVDQDRNGTYTLLPASP